MKIIFMGTPQFAIPSLNALLDSKHQVLAVVTQPDRPKGRRLRLSLSPVKELALKKKIPIIQPSSLNDDEFKKQITNLNPDIIIVVAFGRLIPSWLLNLSTYGCVNLHASLLPKYRGAAPIQRAIMDGCAETGATTMFMDEGLDTGDVLLQKKVPILDDETAGELHDKLSYLGPDLILKTVKGFESNSIKQIKQINAEATFAPKIEKDEAKINWNKPAQEVRNLIRALNPVPGAHTLFNGERLKILRAKEVENKSSLSVGLIIDIKEGAGFVISCKKNALLVLQVQPEGKKAMGADEFTRGHTVKRGDKFE
ncbi:MAG TPA: methionyl-tRNA formyltransferase [Actinobacteria bacterium]|nr:methionyl-tRNA formyltransferase [Actinomycetota bacterium]